MRQPSLLQTLAGSFALLAPGTGAAVPEDCFLVSQLINYLGPDYPYTTDSRAHASLTSEHRLAQIRHCSSDSQVIGIQAKYSIFDSAGRQTKEHWLPPHGTVDDGFLTCESVDLSNRLKVQAMAVFFSRSTITQVGILLSNNQLVEFGPDKGSGNTGARFFGMGELQDYQFFGFSSQVYEEEVDTLATLGLVAVNHSCLDAYLDERGPPEEETETTTDPTGEEETPVDEEEENEYIELP